MRESLACGNHPCASIIGDHDPPALEWAVFHYVARFSKVEKKRNLNCTSFILTFGLLCMSHTVHFTFQTSILLFKLAVVLLGWYLLFRWLLSQFCSSCGAPTALSTAEKFTIAEHQPSSSNGTEPLLLDQGTKSACI